MVYRPKTHNDIPLFRFFRFISFAINQKKRTFTSRNHIILL